MTRIAAVGLVALGLVTPLPLAAQDERQADATPLEALRACAAIAADADRLACYDRGAQALLAATDSGEIEVVDRESAAQTRRALFGFQGVNLPFFKNDSTIEELESTVTRVQGYGRDGYLVTIADGDAVWRIDNPPSRFRQPRVGDRIVIKRGALTSHFLRIGSQTGVKGSRVQ